MQSSKRWIGLAILAPLLGACTSDLGLNSFSVPSTSSLGLNRYAFSGRHSDFSLPAPGPGELVGPQGQCAATGEPGATGADPTSAAVAQGGIALQMTECEVVRRAGLPDKIESGESRTHRHLMLTYLQGPRPGIYTFISGRLAAIERVAEPPPPPRPARASKKGA